MDQFAPAELEVVRRYLAATAAAMAAHRHSLVSQGRRATVTGGRPGRASGAWGRPPAGLPDGSR